MTWSARTLEDEEFDLLLVHVQNTACRDAAHSTFPPDANAFAKMPKNRKEIFKAIDPKRSRSHNELLGVQLRVIVIREFMCGE